MTQTERIMTVSSSPGAGNSDTSLLRGIIDGDRAVFEQLYYRWYKPVYAFMLRTTRSNEDAEDIAQESFARLWKMRDRIDPDGNIQALIFVIARRAAVDHYRRSERSGSIFNSEKTATELPLDSSPEDILEATETRLLLQLAIENMPRKQREVFALHYYDNLTPAEIAARLGLSYENARKQIWRAKQQLREVVTMMGILLLIET